MIYLIGSLYEPNDTDNINSSENSFGFQIDRNSTLIKFRNELQFFFQTRKSQLSNINIVTK